MCNFTALFTKKKFLCGAPFVTVSKARSADGFYFYGNATKVLHSLSIFPICPVLFPTISPSFCRVNIKTNLQWLRKKTCVQNICLCINKYIELENNNKSIITYSSLFNFLNFPLIPTDI